MKKTNTKNDDNDIIDLDVEDNIENILAEKNVSKESNNCKESNSSLKVNLPVILGIIAVLSIIAVFLIIFFNDENRYSRQIKKGLEYAETADYEQAILHYRYASLIVPEFTEAYINEAIIYNKFSEEKLTDIDGLRSQIEDKLNSREYESAINLCDEISNIYAVAIEYENNGKEILMKNETASADTEIKSMTDTIVNNIAAYEESKEQIEYERLCIMNEFKHYNMFEALVSDYNSGNVSDIYSLISSSDYRDLAASYASVGNYIFDADEEGLHVGIYKIFVGDNIAFEDADGDGINETPFKESALSPAETKIYYYIGEMNDSVRSGNGIWISADETSYYTEGQWSDDMPNGNITVNYMTDTYEKKANMNLCISTTGTVVNGIYEGTVRKEFISVNDGAREIWDYQLEHGRIIPYDGMVYGSKNGAALETDSFENIKYIGISSTDLYRIYGVDGFGNEL